MSKIDRYTSIFAHQVCFQPRWPPGLPRWGRIPGTASVEGNWWICWEVHVCYSVQVDVAQVSSAPGCVTQPHYRTVRYSAPSPPKVIYTTKAVHFLPKNRSLPVLTSWPVLFSWNFSCTSTGILVSYRSNDNFSLVRWNFNRNSVSDIHVIVTSYQIKWTLEHVLNSLQTCMLLSASCGLWRYFIYLFLFF